MNSKLNVEKLLNNQELTKNDIIYLLSLDNQEEIKLLFEKSKEVTLNNVGRKVYLRGLIEYSNVCRKNCFYCGIRCSNSEVDRYVMTDEDVFECVIFAYENNLGSIVIQSGERNDKAFIEKIEYLVKQAKKITNDKIGITLSVGEQAYDVYKRWFEAGAHRYLLRIETSDRELYSKLHPNDFNHSYEKRLEAIHNLQDIGYQVGTGVMIGLPYQTLESLANDILFFKKLDVDMVGMGPYVEHRNTPLYFMRENIPTLLERFNLTLRMIATLRLMMKDINIAATTALGTIVLDGRMKAIEVGANVIMPNITQLKYRNKYSLYEGKPTIEDNPENSLKDVLDLILGSNREIGWGEWGDSIHFLKKNNNDLNF